jgi:hypothetical protein
MNPGIERLMECMPTSGLWNYDRIIFHRCSPSETAAERGSSPKKWLPMPFLNYPDLTGLKDLSGLDPYAGLSNIFHGLEFLLITKLPQDGNPAGTQIG